MQTLIPVELSLPILPEGQKEIRVLGLANNKTIYEVTFTRNHRFYHEDRCVNEDWTPYISHWIYKPILPE